MLVIKNKIESARKIKELGINTLPSKIFKKGEVAEVRKFLEQYPAKYYAIRDTANSGGVFKFKVDYEKVLQEIDQYTIFSINVSSINYSDNQLLAGEIEFLSNGEVYATLSTDPIASARSAVANPTFNFKTDIFDNTNLNKIPHLNYLYNYISEHNLKDVVVEFSLFDKEVGLKKEKIIVYELRTHY